MLHNLTVIANRSVYNNVCWPKNMLDHKLLTNKRGQEKIFRQFSKTSYDFNILVDFSRENLKTGYEIRLPTVYNDTLNNSINLYFTHNAPDNKTYHPMTAWIFVHRIHHAMAKSDNMMNGSRFFDQVMWQNLIEIAKILYKNDKIINSKLENWTYKFFHLNDTGFRLAKLVQILFTMRSARTGSLLNPLDFGAECLSQHVISGRVRFNRVRNWDVSRLQMDINVLTLDVDQIDTMIDKMEKEVDQACAETMNSLIGKIIGW